MSDRLQGKTALLTAAAQGIGRATAIAFESEGARVIATDIDAARLDTLRAACGREVRVLDVTGPSASAREAAAIGPVDVRFNAAGYDHSGTVPVIDGGWSN